MAGAVVYGGCRWVPWVGVPRGAYRVPRGVYRVPRCLYRGPNRALLGL